MGLDEIFVHIDTDTRMFERAYGSRIINCERRAAKLISKQIFPRYVRLEIAPVLDGAKEMNRRCHIDTGGRRVRIYGQLPRGGHGRDTEPLGNTTGLGQVRLENADRAILYQPMKLKARVVVLAAASGVLPSLAASA